MATDDNDSLTRSRPLSPSEVIRSLRDNPTGLPRPPAPETKPEVLPAPESPPDAGDPALIDPLPQASDDYAAFGRAANKPLVSLFLMLKDGSWDDFAYANLERIRFLPAEETGGGNELVLRFAGSTVTEVRLQGRNLAKLHAYLGQHRAPWVRELPPRRDYQAAGAAVVTAIAIKEL